MKEGTPVTWAFILFILVFYIGGYIWNIQEDSARLLNIATEQEDIIEALELENKQLHELTETIFKYLDTLERTDRGTTWPRHGNTSPIHSKPL